VDDTLKVILDFVEGSITPTQFEQHVYNNPDLEALLKDEALRWRDTFIQTNPFDYLLPLDFGDLGDVLDAQGAMELYLQRRGIGYKRATSYSDPYDLMLRVQPRWLCVDPSYIATHILPTAGSRQGEELKKWLKGELLKRFQYHKRPPKWIQNPNWPINENGPLVFLGQIDIKDSAHFHDDAAVYVFLDPTTGSRETVVQVA
jgi:hypothetical protein